MLKYFKSVNDGRQEISYGEALCATLSTYQDNQETRDMLKREGFIPLPYFWIEIEEC